MIVKRIVDSSANDLNTVFRPYTLSELLGNELNKKILRNSLGSNQLHHSQLFIGDPGCGKTTVAKIIALGLNCEVNGISSNPCLSCPTCKSIIEGNCIDVKEINVGQTGGKDYVDGIVKDLPTAPFSARFKVLIFDEAHELTNQAKDLLLKPIETGYEHVYFIFCTNLPDKLKTKGKSSSAFLDRCNLLKFKPLSKEDIRTLLVNVCDFEGIYPVDDVIDIIINEADGVPRNALTILYKVIVEGSWDKEEVKKLCESVVFEDKIDISGVISGLNRQSFKEAIKEFDTIKYDIPVETIRISLVGYYTKRLKSAKTFGEGKKFSRILDLIMVPIVEYNDKLMYNRWYNVMFKIITILKEG